MGSLRFFTAVAVVVCMAIAGVFLSWAWTQFSKSPIVVNVETTNYPLYKLPFPAITICPANNVKRTIGEQLLASHLNIPLDNKTRAEFWNVMSALAMCQYPFYFRMQRHLKPILELLPLFSDLNVSDFMLQVLPKCEELFANCFWLGQEVNCCEVFYLQRTETGFCYSFNSLTSEETRDCTSLDEFSQDYQFVAPTADMNATNKCEPRHNIASGTTTGLEVFLKYSSPEDSLGKGQRDKPGARVFFHHPTEFPEAGKGSFIPEKKGMVFKVEVTPSVTESSSGVRALSIAQRQCLFPDELQLSVFHTYTQQNCLMECRLKNMAELCGCHPFFFSALTEKDIPECNMTQLWCVSNHNIELRIFKPPPGTRGFEEMAAIDCSKCLPTCHSSRYSLDYTYSDDSNPYVTDQGGYLDVYYKELGAIKYHQQLAFDFMDLVVSFGGVVSLFLGVSLLSGFQFLYRCVKRCETLYISMHQPHNINYNQAWMQ